MAHKANERVLPEDRERCVCTALRQASRGITQFYDFQLAPTGLRITQWSLLAALDRLERPSYNELAADLALDRTTLARNLEPLENQGLVRTDVNPDDGRSKLVTLTSRGKQSLKRAYPYWRQAQERFKNTFGAKNAEALVELSGSCGFPLGSGSAKIDERVSTAAGVQRARRSPRR